MNTIENFYLPQLHNGENVSFHGDAINELKKAGTVQMGIDGQMDHYLNVYGELKASLDIFSASKLSPESTKKDQARDRLYSAFKAYVKVYMNDENLLRAAAAERIMFVIRTSAKEVGDPLKLGLIKESAALESLIRNLNLLMPDITLIGAGNKLKKLADANQAFIDLQIDRDIEKGGKTSGDVKAARALTDAIYKDIIARINAQILLNGNTAFVSFIKMHGATIEKYKNMIAQRKALKKKVDA